MQPYRGGGAMRVPHNVKSAFREPLNVVFLVIATLVFLAGGGWTTLFGAVAAEFAYMLFTPGSGWYKRVLHGRAVRERQSQRAQMKREILPGLLPQDRARFLRLEMLRNQIPSASAVGFGQEEMGTIYEQMDVLLDKFLQFASKNAQYRAYLVDMVRPAPGPQAQSTHWLDRIFDVANALISEKQESVQIPVNGQRPRRTTDIGAVVEQIQKSMDVRAQQLQAALAGQTSDANRQVVQKNLEVLAKRRARIKELGDIIENLECQLDLIESTFGLISDQVRTLAPEQVIHDINEVVLQTESTTQLLAASAPVEFQLNRLDRTLA